MVRNPLAMQEMQVPRLVQEEPLEEEMATHSNILAWKIPWTEEPGGLQCIGTQRVGHDEATSLHYISIRMSKSRPLTTQNVSEDVEQQNSCLLLAAVKNGTATLEDSWVFSHSDQFSCSVMSNSL